MRSCRRRALSVTLVSLLLLTGGCSAGTWGRLVWSGEVRRDFMEGRVLAGHRYYTSGGENTPRAILGISEEFTLVTERWRERTMTAELLKKLVHSMALEYGSVEAGLSGAIVADEKGGRVGVWYSPVPVSTVKILEGEKVRVYPPVLVGLDDSHRGRSR